MGETVSKTLGAIALLEGSADFTQEQTEIYRNSRNYAACDSAEILADHLEKQFTHNPPNLTYTNIVQHHESMVLVILSAQTLWLWREYDLYVRASENDFTYS
ncbi:unnamed protein product [Euphydryas editha]|uniref:Uncharacterized protein n=1 Tax=Euphydryas editha TaxID=104508 RepID=A0AAU9TAB3_EUPED|nr:unnamed protein product [Euphydryas editha]